MSNLLSNAFCWEDSMEFEGLYEILSKVSGSIPSGFGEVVFVFIYGMLFGRK